MTTIELAREMHDSELQPLLETDDAARAVYAARTEAASEITVVIARMYGRPWYPAQQWHIITCLTDTGTIGILDIARGAAWDSGQPAPAGVADLGLSDEVYGAANIPSGGGPIRFDGEVVQVAGVAVQDGAVTVLSQPAGWRQILLPTWRGYAEPGQLHTRGHQHPPVDAYARDRWIRPTLTADQLMTCYGKLGDPVDDDDLDGAKYLWWRTGDHGVPPWVQATSISVLDRIYRRVATVGGPLHLERLDDVGEAQRVTRLLDCLAATYNSEWRDKIRRPYVVQHVQELRDAEPDLIAGWRRRLDRGDYPAAVTLDIARAVVARPWWRPALLSAITTIEAETT